MAVPKSPDEDKLRRLIYLCNVGGKYCCGGPERNKSNKTSYEDLLNNFLKNSLRDLLNILETAVKDNFLPNKVQVFNLLAILLTLEEANEQNKPKICEFAEKICSCDQDMFSFIKAVVTQQKESKNKVPTTVRKSIIRMYKNKSAEDIAKSYVLHTSCHGWKYKDIIKFFHIKSETVEKNMVINYILFGKTNKENQDGKSLIDMMKKAETLRSTKDPKVAVPLINDLKATIKQVQPTLSKSAEVWNAALLNMSLQDILKSLPRLYRLGFLKKDSPTQTFINDVLTNPAKVKASGIHPLEVFIHMKNFEKGGKAKDPKLLEHIKTKNCLSDVEFEKLKIPTEVKCPLVLSNLQKCMNLSSGNVQSFGKRYLITIDTTDKMDTKCLGCKNLTGIEVAAAFAWLLLKVEKDVTVAVFKEKEIAVIKLDKKAHLYEHVQKLRENKSKYLVLASPMEWAANQKKHFDIFISFIHHKEYYATIPKEVRDKMGSPVDALEKYRKKVNLNNAKLITFCLSSPKMVVAQGQPNVLDIAGLDLAVPKVLEAFCRNNFC